MKVQLTRKNAQIPTKAHSTDAGYDIYCPQDTYVGPGETVKIPCGFKIEIPVSMWGAVCSRSGLASKGLFVTNSPGVIDSGYREEVMVLITNSSDTMKMFKEGDRIAQLLFVPIAYGDALEVGTITSNSDRKGGVGSTGN